MVTRSDSVPQASSPVTHAPGSPVRIGVGIDTSRYGHYAAFLRDDLQPAAAELSFAESAAGYATLRERLERTLTLTPGDDSGLGHWAKTNRQER